LDNRSDSSKKNKSHIFQVHLINKEPSTKKNPVCLSVQIHLAGENASDREDGENKMGEESKWVWSMHRRVGAVSQKAFGGNGC
jgi:hypothetical protein